MRILFDTSTILASAINFILLLVSLTYLLYKPVRKFLDERTKSIEMEIESAKKQNVAAKQLHNQLQSELEHSKEKAREYLDQALQRGEQLQAEIVAEAKKESEMIRKRTKEELALERIQLEEALKKDVAQLAMNISAKVIQDSLDKNKHEKLIHDALVNLEDEKMGGLQQ